MDQTEPEQRKEENNAEAEQPRPSSEWKSFHRQRLKEGAIATGLYFIVLVAFLIPFCWNAFGYNAPILPSVNENSTIRLNIRIMLAATSDVEKSAVDSLLQRLAPSLNNIEIDSPVRIQWKLENAGIRSYDKLLAEGGDGSTIRLALVYSERWPHFSANKVYLSAGGWAFVQWNGDIEQTSEQINNLIDEVLVDVAHLNIITQRFKRERLKSWQIAALSPSHQKRLVWDSAPISTHYIAQVVYLHHNATTDEILPPTVTNLLKKYAKKLQPVTKLEISSEHLWDFGVESYLEKDVQDRWSLNQNDLDNLIKEVESQLQTVESPHPVLRFVVIEGDHNVIILDEYLTKYLQREDSMGATIAAWGAVVPRNEHTAARVAYSLRVLLGLDADLKKDWVRAPVPLADWELVRLRLRAYVDNLLTIVFELNQLKRLTETMSVDIDNEVVRRVEEAHSLLMELLSSSEFNLEKAGKARILADEAARHHTLLTTTFLPKDAMAALILPLIPFVSPIVMNTLGFLNPF